ncbi:MAG: hypothetical protein ACI9R3_006227, partial [Verrucomicrobiales bacterium]
QQIKLPSTFKSKSRLTFPASGDDSSTTPSIVKPFDPFYFKKITTIHSTH